MINKVLLVGRLGQDPELKHAGETDVCNLSVATSERRKKGDQWESVTEWHRVVLFGKQAEFASTYLKKGALVLAEGKLKTEKWTDKDGGNRETVKVYAHTIQALEKREERQQAAPAASAPTDDDIPF